MKGSYGRILYGVQGLGDDYKGTVAGAFGPIGRTDRVRVSTPSGIEVMAAVGDLNEPEFTEGMTQANVSFSMPVVQEPFFLQNARRDPATGELPWLSFTVGYHKGDYDYTVTVIDCKIDTMTLRCDGGGRLNADIAAIGGKAEAVETEPPGMDFLTARPYGWYNMTWDEVRDLMSYELNVRNNLDPVALIAGSGTTRDPARIWDQLDEGQNDVTGTLQYFLGDEDMDLQACLVPGADHAITFESCDDVSPVQTMTLNLRGLKPTDNDLQIGARANIIFEVPYLAQDWELS